MIAKYGKPLPYFMKYAGPYYKTLHEFSHAKSNMNQLCFALESWGRRVRWNKRKINFNYMVMFNEDIGYDQTVFEEVERVYHEFNKVVKDNLAFEHKCRNYDVFKEELKDQGVTKEIAVSYETNWEAIYGHFRNKCTEICPDVCELANIAVILCYKKYPARPKKFMWRMAGRGVVENIKRVPMKLPQEDPAGDYVYLGHRYSLVDVNTEEEPLNVLHGLCE